MDVTAVDSHPVRNPDPASDITRPVSDGSPSPVWSTPALSLAVPSTEPEGITREISREMINTH